MGREPMILIFHEEKGQDGLLISSRSYSELMTEFDDPSTRQWNFPEEIF